MPSSPVPIALVLNTFESGGTEYQMVELMRRLDPRRFTLHVACFGDRGVLRPRVESAAASITEFPLRGLISASGAAQLLHFARWCRRRRLRVLHACDFYGNVFALPAARLAGVPVRIGSRRDVLLLERTPAQRRVQRLSYGFAHQVVANSAAAVERLAFEGVPPQKVTLIPNGLDLARFAIRGSAPRKPTVTTVAHLRDGKGHDVLIAAAAKVIQARPDAQFQIIGEGPRLPALEQQASALKIAASVQFLGYRDDIPERLHDSAVFAFPSFMEASPNAVLEAMAAALPIAATNVGGIPELITHGQTGLLVPPGNPDSLASAILTLLNAPRLAESLGAAARRHIENRHSFERMAADFSALYSNELTRRSRPMPHPSDDQDYSADQPSVSGRFRNAMVSQARSTTSKPA